LQEAGQGPGGMDRRKAAYWAKPARWARSSAPRSKSEASRDPVSGTAGRPSNGSGGTRRRPRCSRPGLASGPAEIREIQSQKARYQGGGCSPDAKPAAPTDGFHNQLEQARWSRRGSVNEKTTATRSGHRLRGHGGKTGKSWTWSVSSPRTERGEWITDRRSATQLTRLKGGSGPKKEQRFTTWELRTSPRRRFRVQVN